MFQQTRFQVLGSKQTSISCTLLQAESDHLCILFPGRGYSTKMSLLYYLSSLLLQKSMNVLHVNYDYQHQNFTEANEEAQRKWVQTDADLVFNHVLDQMHFKKFTVIGKSIGTIAMGHLLQNRKELADANAIWLTPLIHLDSILTQMKNTHQKSLCVIGDQDPCYSPDRVKALSENYQFQVMTVSGADHSLELEGNVFGSIETLQQVMREIDAFLHTSTT